MTNLASAFDLIETIKDHGFDAKIAGGAVRDILLNVIPKDIDIATTALPSDIINIFSGTHKVLPTGISHGTVTVMKNDVPYEITTLRIDKETDGRHALVEFTDDWELDASRRDFTINAMFMDENKEVLDFFNGKKDLETKTIRFVGDASKRIQEDYLRILRYFRFLSRFDGRSIHSDIEAIRNNVSGLEKISEERIFSEISKTVLYKHVNVIRVMNLIGVSYQIFNKNLETWNMKDFDNFELVLHSMGVGSNWFLKYKAPNDIIKRIKFLETFVPSELNYDTFKFGEERMQEFSDFNNLKWKVPVVPKFPVSGNDVVGLTGPEIGKKLEEMQKKWAASNFKMTKEELLKC